MERKVKYDYAFKLECVELVLIYISVFATSCSATVGTSTNTKKIPPGQAKKISGDKSAKKYAPGQNKG